MTISLQRFGATPGDTPNVQGKSAWRSPESPRIARTVLALLLATMSGVVSEAAGTGPDPKPVVADAPSFPAGTRVQFDRVEATRPDLGRWDEGVIVRRDPLGRYVIRRDNGITYTIQADSRFLLPMGAPLPGPRWDGSPAAAGSSRVQPAPAEQPAVVLHPGGAGKEDARSLPSGTHVQFDRVEALRPENGRWDKGVVVGRDHWGRYQIRSDNGLLYSIHDDPRWILPAGATLQGPRHDSFNIAPSAPSVSPRPVVGAGGGITPGPYMCSFFNVQSEGLDFTVTGPGSYTYSGGGGGSYRLDAGSGRVSFTGPIAELMRDDQLTAHYTTKSGRPAVSFESPRGGEVAGCFLK